MSGARQNSFVDAVMDRIPSYQFQEKDFQEFKAKLLKSENHTLDMLATLDTVLLFYLLVRTEVTGLLHPTQSEKPTSPKLLAKPKDIN